MNKEWCILLQAVPANLANPTYTYKGKTKTKKCCPGDIILFSIVTALPNECYSQVLQRIILMKLLHKEINDHPKKLFRTSHPEQLEADLSSRGILEF
jgi:hypothetical protein